MGSSIRFSRYEKAVHYLATRWKSGRTLKDVAADFRVDAGNLERAFRHAFGVTVREYVCAKRRQYTLDRLRDDGVFGYEIGSELGFASDLSFYHWVKREFGIPLSTLRARTRLASTNHQERIGP